MALTYANAADRLLDMRDEEMALRDDEVTGELPPDLEYEEFNEIREQLAAIIEEQLAIYKTRQTTDLGWWCASIWRAIPARAPFRRGAYCYRSAGTSWRSASRFPPTGQPNGSRHDYGAKGYRRMSLTNIEQVMPVVSAQALANCYFRRC